MPIFTNDDTSIYYEIHGEGFPVLLFAPGGMRSALSFWAGSPWNPITTLSPHFQVIAMDQRNAGQSRAPITANDGWRLAWRLLPADPCAWHGLLDAEFWRELPVLWNRITRGVGAAGAPVTEPVVVSPLMYMEDF